MPHIPASQALARFRVIDRSGAVIANAEISLLGDDNKPTRTALTDAKGETVFTDLPFGNCRFRINQTGFQQRPLTLTIQSAEELKIETTLELGTIGEYVLIENSPVGTVTPVAGPKRPKRRRWLIFR